MIPEKTIHRFLGESPSPINPQPGSERKEQMGARVESIRWLYFVFVLFYLLFSATVIRENSYDTQSQGENNVLIVHINYNRRQ